MKRFYAFSAALAALTFLSGCAKEEIQDPQAEGGKTVITAGFADTRTVLLEDGKVFWTTGDQIVVNGVTSETLNLDGGSAQTVDFVLDGVLDKPYKAFFPASMYVSGTTVDLPASQGAHGTSFAADASPMVAYATEGNNLLFSHLCSVVKLVIKLPAENPDTDKIDRVEFSGLNDEQVCGEFTVDYEAKTLTSAGSGKTVSVAVDRAATEEGIAVHIVVPAGNYEKGFSVKIADENGHYMQATSSSMTELKQGTLYTMDPIAFEPDKTEVGVEITSVQDLIDFATKWNKGEYTSTAENPLVVTLTQDLVFTKDDNAAWPGIGNTSGTEFTGQFNGNEKSISGFTSSISLFPFIGSDAEVSNLTLSGNVTYDLTNCSADENVGPFAKRTKGTLIGCTSNVNVTLTSTQSISVKFRAGGFAGYMNGGSMTDCAYTGTFKWGTESSCTQESRIGGVVGFVEGESSAELDGCYMSGTMQLDGVTGTAYWGGLFGQAKAKMVKNCFTDDGATITVASTKSVRLGGIAGFASGVGSFDGCVNNASLILNSSRPDSYSDVGGVVGRNQVAIQNCDNAGSVTITAGAVTQRVGGVVGYNNEGSVNSCDNTAEIRLNDSTEGKTRHVGGCVGYTTKSVTGNNSGNITWNSATTGWMKDGVGANNFGGIVGWSSASISGVKNTGDVIVNESSKGSTTEVLVYSGLNIGGVVAKLENSESVLQISSAINEGDVRLSCGSSNVDYTDVYAGGILAYTSTGVTISNADNSGRVVNGKGKKVNDKTTNGFNHAGGIAGYISGASSISTCNNYGGVWIDDYNNWQISQEGFEEHIVSAGGIVGYSCGVDGTRITIQDCNVAVTGKVDEGLQETASDYNLKARRGYLGGIVGYATYTDVNNCDNTSAQIGSSAYYVGAICGGAISSTFVKCDAKTDIQSSQLRYGGGIVALGDTSLSISECSYSGYIYCSQTSTTITDGKIGGILGKLNSGTATISDSSFGGYYRINKKTNGATKTAFTVDNYLGEANENVTKNNISLVE